MKHINIKFKLILLAGTALIMGSCSDFLNVTPNDKLQTSNLFKTPTQAEQSVIGIYSDLRPLSNDEYLYMSECRSDNAWVNPKPDGERDYSEIGTFRAGSDLATINSVWDEWYKVIMDANTCIEKIPDIDFTDATFKNQLLGESYFLRGWAYFELARLYGNIPIVDKPMSATEVATIKQSTASVVYHQMVVPDLTKAISMLPDPTAMMTADGKTVSGRADKIAATAMLGRAYMTMAGFPLKETAAEDSADVEFKAVMAYSAANGNKYWAPDSTEWKKQWISENNNEYSIFAIQYRSGGTGNEAVFDFSPALPPTYTSMRIFGNQIYIDKALMYRMSLRNSEGKPDARIYNTTILTGYDAEKNWPAYSNLYQSLTLPDGTVIDSVLTNTMYYKYMNSLRKRAALGYTTDIETSMKDYNDWPVNFPVIRLEDIELMHAEVLLDKNSDVAGAIAIVNKIRTRAGMDALSTSMSVDSAMQAVKDERQIELCGEGVRWFDIVRWGEWKKDIIAKFDSYTNNGANESTVGVYDANVKDGMYLYPIPLNEMEVEPGLYTQNPGYN